MPNPRWERLQAKRARLEAERLAREAERQAEQRTKAEESEAAQVERRAQATTPPVDATRLSQETLSVPPALPPLGRRTSIGRRGEDQAAYVEMIRAATMDTGTANGWMSLLKQLGCTLEQLEPVARAIRSGDAVAMRERLVEAAEGLPVQAPPETTSQTEENG